MLIFSLILISDRTATVLIRASIHQYFTGRASELAITGGIGIGSGYLSQTKFEKVVFSDLTGERSVLLGCLAGCMEEEYNLFRK
jgi:ketol-acid reductoisomerase